jgi:mono/diheme cytochrome c family protein
MDDFRRIFYGVIIGFILMILVWISILTFSSCGSSLSCPGAAPTAVHTSIPTLVPATLPPVNRLLGAAAPAGTQVAAGPTAGGTQSEPESTEEAAARPSNPGGPGQAVSLKGDPNSGQQIFASNCQVCHAAQGEGGNPNPGSADGSIPPLNPIDATINAADYQTFATNIDLFVEHGSTPEGPSPTFSMPAWGDKKLLTPQQIADVIAYVIGLNGGPSARAPVATSAASPQPTGSAVAGAGSPTQSEPEPTEEAARPSNPGGPGPALNLTGDPNAGAQVFVTNCQVCHNTEGKGGNPNPGSADGTIPALNPIDPTIKNPDPKVFATNIDLFVEHGSTPEGPGPTFSMPAWGDKALLTPQQIADVIAYVMSLNK